MKTATLLSTAIAILGLGLHPSTASAQGTADLAKQTQNPVSDLISLPFQNNFLFTEDNDLIWNLNIQPVIPFALNEDWNLITRTIIPVLAFEESLPGFDSFGLGDVNATLFLSPRNDSSLIWGIGPTMTFPTATDTIFGADKWSAGPSLVVLTMPGSWVVGSLMSNQWSYAGDDARADVNSFLIQPFINRNFDGGWYATSSPVITADWNADSDERWTVPLGGGFGKIFSIGSQPINAQLQGFYNVEHPSGAPEWSVRLQVQLLFPK
jgi:hypothetical protein